LPQSISYSPLLNYCSIPWIFLSLSYFPVNTRDVFAVVHFVGSTLLAFKLQAIPAFIYFPYAFILSYFHTYSRLSLLIAEIPSILYSLIRYKDEHNYCRHRPFRVSPLLYICFPPFYYLTDHTPLVYLILSKRNLTTLQPIPRHALHLSKIL
jgi:hypothetical protein